MITSQNATIPKHTIKDISNIALNMHQEKKLRSGEDCAYSHPTMKTDVEIDQLKEKVDI